MQRRRMKRSDVILIRTAVQLLLGRPSRSMTLHPAGSFHQQPYKRLSSSINPIGYEMGPRRQETTAGPEFPPMEQVNMRTDYFTPKPLK